MDSQQFLLPTNPNLYSSSEKNVNKAVEKQVAKRSTAANPRYPGYAAIAEDGNIFTDYRPKCEKNIPTGQQYATRQWFQHNAENIINYSREKQAREVGGGFYHAETVPSSVAVVKCDAASCSFYPGKGSQGIPTGIERADVAPELFGTFNTGLKMYPPSPKHPQTNRYEGGRNTPRGSLGPTKV